MDSLEAIQHRFLKGQELQAQGMALSLEAFNELLARVSPQVPIPVGTQVQIELLEGGR